ncbi:hypothetical protein [Sinorhizobium meliloti]|uniref:hypothetical protein n=1 Tax=Rhizobium meliloti TaxID=382 RepID=UPI003F170E9A
MALASSSKYRGPLVPTLRLFLSVDLVGSTAFKQTNQNAFKVEEKSSPENIGEPWFSPIAQFYKEVERLFAREWQAYVDDFSANNGWPAGEAPQLWKSAGDELLYIKVLKDHREALATIICWKKAIDEYRHILHAQYPSLDLKCTAWLAGFPVTNTEVVFRRSVETGSIIDDDDPIYVNMSLLHEHHLNPNDPNLTKDFIGPSIDTGFRLCSLSSARKFIISVDLALMLVHALRAKPVGSDSFNLKIHYDGRAPLKGVLRGKEYPVFWIDMASESSLEKLEDRLLSVSHKNTDDIKDFCEEFFQTHSNSIIIPYIVGNQDPYFANVPTHHDAKLNRLREYWEGESVRRRDEKDSAISKGEGKEIASGDIERLMTKLIKTISDITK